MQTSEFLKEKLFNCIKFLEAQPRAEVFSKFTDELKYYLTHINDFVVFVISYLIPFETRLDEWITHMIKTYYFSASSFDIVWPPQETIETLKKYLLCFIETSKELSK
jgi:hypothetical protein